MVALFLRRSARVLSKNSNKTLPGVICLGILALWEANSWLPLCGVSCVCADASDPSAGSGSGSCAQDENAEGIPTDLVLVLVSVGLTAQEVAVYPNTFLFIVLMLLIAAVLLAQRVDCCWYR